MAQERRCDMVKHFFIVLSVITSTVLVSAIPGAAQERRVIREDTSAGHAGWSKQSSNTDTETTWTNEHDTVRVKARNLELTDDGQAIKALHADGYLFIKEERGGATRELKVTQAAGGNLERLFLVQGRSRDFDAEAQAWLSKILLEFVRNSGFASDQRVRWILQQNGVSGVLTEVSLIASDNIKRAYLQKLVEHGSLDSANLVRILEKARQEITSDYELTEFLIAFKEQVNMNADVRAAFLRTLNRLRSDYDRGRVLTAVSKTDR